jgi:hypothetical protein
MAILAGILVIAVLLGVSTLATLFAVASEAEVVAARPESPRGEPPTLSRDVVQALRAAHRAR